MQNIKISIIIPLYNVEQHIKKAARSLVEQAFNGLEIVLVDDGSSDNSLLVFENSLLNLKVKSIRQENQGPGGARNTGIRAATGEFVMFLDADDFLLPNAFTDIHAIISKEKPDIIFGSYNLWTEEKGIIETKKAITKPPNDPKQLTDYIIGKQPLVSWGPVRYICRHEFLLEHSIFFETGVLCEDIKWSIDLLMAAENNGGKITFLHEPFYVYNYRRQGSTMNSINPKRLIDLNNTVAYLLTKFIHRPVICIALVRESFFYANEFFLLNKEDKELVMESYKKVLPLYTRSKFVFHRIAGKLQHPFAFFVFSAALYTVKIVRRTFINLCWVLKLNLSNRKEQFLEGTCCCANRKRN